MPSPGNADQTEVLAFLGDAATHALAAGERVDRVTTHISELFLAGDRAYKLKRAVRYSYLDFSTLERRRAACEAELAINRRAAPELYLEVRAVRRGGDGRLTLALEGEPVDWLVVMRRFDQSTLLDRMAEAGTIDAPLARAVADAVADLHDLAEITTEEGGRAGIKIAFGITRDNLRLHPERLEPALVTRWVARARSAMDRLTPLLEGRRATGHVRAGHGDLHIGNICVIDGRPTLFDALEFDPSLARADVLYDLAFLLMDLAHRERPDLANAVLNRYLDRRAEIGGLPALPLFLSIRAAIRAQIAATRAGGDPAGYLALALRLLDPEKPRLVAIGGLSGTGKSTLAAGLAPLIGPAPGARILRTDVIRKALAGVPETTRLGEEHYAESVTRCVHHAIANAARETLAAGHAVVVDAVFGDLADRAAIDALARSAGVAFTGLWLTAPVDVLEARVAARRNDASDATVDILGRQIAHGLAAPEWRVLDVSGSPGEALSAAKAALDLSPGVLST